MIRPRCRPQSGFHDLRGVIQPLIQSMVCVDLFDFSGDGRDVHANSHLKIMQSFVAAPQVHIAALKKPAMRGGPFINYDASRAAEIKIPLERTIKEQAHMLELATAIQTLNEILSTEAGGFSLEPLYSKIPAILKGYVLRRSE